LLTEDQIAAAGLEGWRDEDKALVASYSTGDFATGLRMVNAVGEAAEAADHHPDLTLTYPSVRVLLTSHDVGGITQRDLDLAARVGEIAAGLDVAVDQ
ncbi:MAG TPA: 4a-hydroxytetrahydrobiopterin dehydratase, partial [Nocardioides sp.]|nr:4a-hydroxytetrahydrobiopterin dehydratase [Nocardioides sp.]